MHVVTIERVCYCPVLFLERRAPVRGRARQRHTGLLDGDLRPSCQPEGPQQPRASGRLDRQRLGSDQLWRGRRRVRVEPGDVEARERERHQTVSVQRSRRHQGHAQHRRCRIRKHQRNFRLAG